MIMNTSRFTPSVLRLFAVLVILVLTTETWGNRLEFEEADTLPQVENILFSVSHVGVVSQDGRLFALDRQTQRVHQLDAPMFAQQYPKPWPPKPYEIPQSGPRILRSSTGQEFQLTPSVCYEGERAGHAIYYQQRPFPEVLKPCTSLSALEIIGDQVWFGTVHPYEGGEGEAEGLVVQARDKKRKLAAISTKSGLTPGPVRMLREDPYTKTVWVATERGLAQIDHQFRVRWARYWHEDFDASSGRSQTSLITDSKSSNAFAVLGRELGVQDWHAYREVVQSIPAALQRWGDFRDFQWVLYKAHMGGLDFPQDLNGLLPFVMQAAQSEDPKVHLFGLGNVCKFNDVRAQEFLKTLANNASLALFERDWIQTCLKRWETQKP
jgi:hypothetical protein